MPRAGRLRVLHFIYDDPENPWVGGGGAVRLVEIYRRLGDQLDVALVTGNYPGARAGVIDGLRFIRLGAERPYPWSRLTYGRAATEMLRRGDYDAAVFDFSAYTPIVLPPGRPVGVALGQMAGPTARRRWGRVAGGAVALWERRQLRSARWVSAVSRWLLEQAEPHLSPDADRAVVGAGVPDELFDLRREDRGFVLYYGRFDVFQKGIDDFFAVAARISEEHPEVRFVIAGRGRDEERIRGWLRRARWRDRAEMIAGVSEEKRAELLSTAAVLVMPSRFEGFGMVAAEAMAAGLPVVGTAVDSLPEVVSPPEGGILVPGGNTLAMADQVSALLASPERRAGLGRSARESARRFSWDVVAADHLRFLERIAREG